MVFKPIGIIIAIFILFVFLAGIFSFVKNPTESIAVRHVTVPNNSVEQVSIQSHTPVSWHSDSWGTNTVKFSYLPTGHTGMHSLKTEIIAYTDGDAKWYFEPQPVTPGDQYTFTDYYKSNVSSRIVLKFEKKDGSLFYKELESAPAASDWTHYQASFIVPTDTTTVTALHLLSAVGYLITDDYQISNYVSEGFNRGLLSITWDDGFESQYTKALPLHKEYSLPGTFFLISGYLDKPLYMSTAQASELQAAGNELGSHTTTHPDLTTLSLDSSERELRQSQTNLQGKFGTSLTDFATPYGAYNDQVIAEIKKYYRSHRSVEEGFNAKNYFDVYDIVVKNVYTNTPPSQVETWVNKAKADKTWLVLVYHQVDNPRDQYSVSSSDLDREFHSMKNSGMPILTIDQALKEILPQIKNKPIKFDKQQSLMYNPL